MKHFWKNYLEDNTFFWVFSIVGTILLIVAFFLPPLSIIDSSILIATGELSGFIALGCVCKAIDKGGSATLKHKDTELTIGKRDED